MCVCVCVSKVWLSCQNADGIYHIRGKILEGIVEKGYVMHGRNCISTASQLEFQLLLFIYLDATQLKNDSEQPRLALDLMSWFW